MNCGMYIVLVDGKLAMNLFSLLVIQPKPYLYSCVSMLTRVENADASTGIEIHFFC